MKIETMIQQAGLPLLIFAVGMYYGIRLLVTQDAALIRGRDKKPLKDEKAYARGGGKIILFLGAGTLLMTVLSFINIYAAVGELVLCIVIMGIAWKRLADRYEK